MTRKKIVIRVDGNSNIGLGHIYRGIALAEMLKEEVIIEFITKSDSAISPIQEAMFDYVFIPNHIELLQEPFWLKENYSTDTIIILDGYAFNENYQKQIKEYNFKLVYIDDLLVGTQKADLVINHSPGARIEDYNAESYTQFALGTDYSILRPSFLNAAKHIREITKINIAFVCFGGSDIYDLTYTATKALLRIKQIKKINIVIGGAYNHERIFELHKQYSIITIYQNLSEKDLFSVMSESNFAIAPASTVLYELCSVKMPVLSGYYAENQRGILKSLLYKEAIFSCNDMREMSENDFKDHIVHCINSDFNVHIKKQEKLFDGNARKRLTSSIKALGYRLRNINPDDLELLYIWVNDKDVRRNALNQKTVKFEEHCNWFSNIINSDSSYIYILENWNGNPVGQIRFSFINGDYIIDYSIDSKYRGKGLGELIIQDGIERLKSQIKNKITLLAQVKSQNIASKKIFLKFDFENIRNIDDVIFFKKII